MGGYPASSGYPESFILISSCVDAYIQQQAGRQVENSAFDAWHWLAVEITGWADCAGTCGEGCREGYFNYKSMIVMTF
jgi:hypothetical protein